MGIIQTLVICEKPDAATRVARALDDDGDPRRIDSQGVPLYESRRRKESIFVCSALGHLYAIDSKSRSSRRNFPVWDNLWKAKHLFDKKSHRLGRWIETISSIADQSDRFVNACDYDLEGSVIGHMILQYACKNAQGKALRMKFSTMTEDELRKAYRTLSPGLDLSQVEAGKCRHELDWLYGINLSRLLTESALRQNRGYSTLSTGRVQGPTLKFVVKREEDIQSFAPTPFWTIQASIKHNGQTYRIEYNKERISSRAGALKIVQDCNNSLLTVENVESDTVQQRPPHPFDLSTLQSEAYKHFGYSPARTLSIAEKLYLESLISYPRTSSQVLPPDIGYSTILNRLAGNPRYRASVQRLSTRNPVNPNQGSKQDSAHPAIYPTGETPRRRLLRDEANLLDLVIKRFMTTFAASSLHQIIRINLRAKDHRFLLTGSTLMQGGWTEFYEPYASLDSDPTPDLLVGDIIRMEAIEAEEKFTEPPPRFNSASLLQMMEKENLGTKATRAETIDTLYRRDYIKGTRIEPTFLAAKIIGILEKYCPLVIDSTFTARLEEQLELIQSNQASRTEILVEAAERLRPIMLDLVEKEDAIGTQLAETVVAQRTASLTLSVRCPTCGAELRIVKSRRSGKRFIGCTSYAKGCKFTLPLPQFGKLSLASRKCGVCGFQQIQIRTRFRGARISCPLCYSIRNRAKSSISSGSESKPRTLEVPAST